MNTTPNTKKFNAGFYQLDSDNNQHFSIEIDGTIVNQLDSNRLSQFLTKKLFLLSNAIDQQKAKNNGKHLFKGFKVSKPVFFYFNSEGFNFDTQTSEKLTIVLKSFMAGKLVDKDLFCETLNVLIDLQMNNEL